MNETILEADWKVFSSLHPIALDRFCQRTLDEVADITADTGKSHHARFRALYKLIRNRNKEAAQLFDDFRRSTAQLQLLLFHRHGLLTEEEIKRFSPELQEWLRLTTRELGGDAG